MIALTLYDGKDTPIMVRGTHREAAGNCDARCGLLLRVTSRVPASPHRAAPRRYLCSKTPALGLCTVHLRHSLERLLRTS